MVYKTPGVYIEEISKLPPSVAQVNTAIPAFIGYTQQAEFEGRSLLNTGVRIKSFQDYVTLYGGAYQETINVPVIDDNGLKIDGVLTAPTLVYRMFYTMQMYFANGGGPCYIISIGVYPDPTDPAAPPPSIDADLLQNEGLDVLKKEDEPTIICFPDAVAIADVNNFYSVYQQALIQCADLQDRVAICDVYNGNLDFTEPVPDPNVIETFRDNIGTNNLRYGAAYYPWLKTTLSIVFDESRVNISGGGLAAGTVLNNGADPDADPAPPQADMDTSLKLVNNQLYNEIKQALANLQVVLPPSGIMAGIYARVDNDRGVWKAPANVSVTGIAEPTVTIDNSDQEGLNVDTSGKSINAIRKFTGKGILVWGARTLAGNDNEWRYISVRRFFNMVEESVKKATEQFVFEPNDRNTWSKVRSMIENFLILQWRAGALAGASPEQAFFVNVGLPETMTSLDILEGRMIVEIGMAVVRPAEFIILKFSHKMQES